MGGSPPFEPKLLLSDGGDGGSWGRSNAKKRSNQFHPACSKGGSARQRPFGRGLLGEAEVVVFDADQDRLAFVEGPFEDLLSQRIFQRTFDSPAHGPRAISGVVAFGDQQLFGLLVELEN